MRTTVEKRSTFIPEDKVIPASAYQTFLSCSQGVPDTTITDRSGNAADGVMGAVLTPTNCWSNPGWMTFVDGGNDGAVKVPVSNITWDMYNGDSLLICFTTKNISKASTSKIFNTAETTGDTGFRFLISSATGQLSNLFFSDDVGEIGPSGTYGVDLSAATVNHFFAVDGVAKTMSYWQDGEILVQNYDMSTGTGTTTQPTKPLLIGGNQALLDTTGGQWQNVHVLAHNGGLPTNMQEVVTRLYERPWAKLSQVEYPL